MNDYDPAILALNAKFAAQREDVRQMLRKGGRLDLLADFDRKMREIDTSIEGARMCWHSISPAQRRALIEARRGSRLVREMGGNGYRANANALSSRPAYLPTIRALCAHALLAWDGDAFDPEAAAVITERGLFVLKHGPASHAE